MQARIVGNQGESGQNVARNPRIGSEHRDSKEILGLQNVSLSYGRTTSGVGCSRTGTPSQLRLNEE
jgi:hypothetical protein